MATIKDEVAKEVIGLAGVVLTILIVRWMNQPDAYRTAKMMTAVKVKEWCNRRALNFLDLADKANAIYESEQP